MASLTYWEAAADAEESRGGGCIGASLERQPRVSPLRQRIRLFGSGRDDTFVPEGTAWSNRRLLVRVGRRGRARRYGGAGFERAHDVGDELFGEAGDKAPEDDLGVVGGRVAVDLEERLELVAGAVGEVRLEVGEQGPAEQTGDEEQEENLGKNGPGDGESRMLTQEFAMSARSGPDRPLSRRWMPTKPPTKPAK